MKKSIVTILKTSMSMMVALMFLVTISGCGKEEVPMEKTGKKVDESFDKGKDAMNDAADKATEKNK